MPKHDCDTYEEVVISGRFLGTTEPTLFILEGLPRLTHMRTYFLHRRSGSSATNQLDVLGVCLTCSPRSCLRGRAEQANAYYKDVGMI